MPIYKQTAEIMNIDDIWTGVDRDIVEVYFGDKNVFTVWGEYEGTLPATLNANGNNMKQYQIYGNTGGVGDKTANLFDFNANNPDNGFVYGKGLTSTGDYENFSQANISEFISITPFSSYTFVYGSQYNEVYAALYNAQKEFVRSIKYNGRRVITFSSQDESYLRFTYFRASRSAVYVVKGSTAPASFVPFGYKLDMGVKSGNIYNTAETSWSADGTILNDAGEPISSEGSHYTTNFIPVEPGEAYYLAGSLANETRWRVYFYDSNKNWIRRTGSKSPGSTRLIAMDENASYFQLQVGTDISSTADWNFVHSRTAPEKYQSYFNTVTPIYIGSDPLGEDEYIDCQAGKIYRMINGTLTPTDPPVALPTLPTVEGTTIVDYAGSGTAPEKVLLKYRKKNF